MTEWCVFHIPSSEYVYCHVGINSWAFLPKIGSDLQIQKQATVWLLPPGIPISYDSGTVFFRGTWEDLLSKLKEEITAASLHWKDILIEEFELQPFHKGLVPLNHRWKEFHENGSLKTTLEKSGQ